MANTPEREALGLLDPENPFVRAARWNDSIAEEHGLEEACRIIGVDLTTVLKLARQRAIKMRLIETGRMDELEHSNRTNGPSLLPLSDEDESRIGYLTMLYLDGIVLGYRAHIEETGVLRGPSNG